MTALKDLFDRIRRWLLPSSTDSVARLQAKAEKLEERAVEAETIAGLRKRMSEAQKRIAVATGKSGKRGK